MTACSKTGCLHEAKWRPVLVLAVPGYEKPNQACRAQLTLALCDECKAVSTMEDFLTDGGWDFIADQLVTRGKARPARELTKLEFVSLDSPEARDLDRAIARQPS